MDNSLETIIGLEIHVQLKTASKMFCACPNDGENRPPNTTICPICLGHPGTLPVPNNLAIRWSVLAARALNCTINEYSKFDRKHYFYPDLPKGYQISQFDQPIAEHGYLDIEVRNEIRRIGITRLHLEEDAAKLQHAQGGVSLVDFNRGGTPLIEIVTEPDMRSPEEAKVFMQEPRLTMRHLGVSDADMEKGHLRCDANISMRSFGDEAFSPKTEVKNINSFKFVERALTFEQQRQRSLWETGTPPDASSTRGWNEQKGITEAQRAKEESSDYRYFPEPDIPPLHFTREWLREVEIDLPETPRAKRQRFEESFGLSPANARVLVESTAWSGYAEHVVSELQAWLEAYADGDGAREEVWEHNKKQFGKLVGGWLVSKLSGLMTEKNISFDDLKVTPENFAEFLSMIFRGQLTSRMGQDVLRVMVDTGNDPSDIIEEGGFEQVSDTGALEDVIDAIINRFPDQVSEWRAGKEPVLKFFIGQAMKKTKGQADPVALEELFRKKLIE